MANDEKELDEQGSVEVERNETLSIPWAAAIIIGILIVLIVACFIVIKVIEG